MIVEYHRPKTLKDAMQLLSRKSPETIPLGGGTGIHQNRFKPVAVVDLQDLQLTGYSREGDNYSLGATTTLESLVDWDDWPTELREISKQEFTLNTRNCATVAGVLVTATGKSRLAAALLAVDCKLVWEPGRIEIFYGDWLALRNTWREARLITGVSFKYPYRLCFRQVTRTPMDIPIIGICKAKWRGGRTRLVITGYGQYPQCVYDGNEDSGLVAAAQNAHSHIAKNKDHQYIQKMLEILIGRCKDRESHED